MKLPTFDSVTNFIARLGLGQKNQISETRYSFDFLTRNRTELEAAYRTSWIVRAACDMVAEDMTREGIEIEGTLPPDNIEALTTSLRDLNIWGQLTDVVRWSRLFGGAVGVLMIDGQDPAMPLNLDTIGPGQFKGLLVLDRWQLNTQVTELVTDLGPHFGMPKFYQVVASDTQQASGPKIHYTRLIRMDGLSLPYYQRWYENLWGQSVIEAMHDRVVALDSTTMGAAQLVFKAHLRTYSVENLREIVAMGGKAMEGLAAQIDMMRLYQSNEGITLMDAKDKFETHSYTFSGLSDVLLQFFQQVSGALQIPLVRLLGQSPAGLNSTGEADLRTYYDGITRQQETRLRQPLTLLLDVLCRSTLGHPAPKGFSFRFRPLWQMTDEQKAATAQTVGQAVASVYDSGLVPAPVALRELRQSSRVTGIWSNITDQDIEDAENSPPRSELTDPSTVGLPDEEEKEEAQA